MRARSPAAHMALGGALLAAAGLVAQDWPDEGRRAWTPPILEHQAPADFPAEARAAGLYGVVFVAVEVSEEGYVGRAEVVDADHPELEGAAFRAARAARFLPGTEFDRPRRARAVLTYLFNAGDDIRPPRLVTAPAPAIPADLRAPLRPPLRAAVTIRVDELGCVYDVLDARADAADLLPAVRDAAWEILLTPRIHNGRPVACEVEVVYDVDAAWEAVAWLRPGTEGGPPPAFGDTLDALFILPYLRAPRDPDAPQGAPDGGRE